ncbi:MAG: cellulase family glycosylhydrolase [Verrucomicrobia bacterium]|nr:cellulase family glycosylhydrolase [Verrucomicrobiota bacterium]
MRRFLLLAGIATILSSALAAPPRTFPYPRPLPEPSAAKLPRWRGFNLLYFFNARSAPTSPNVMEEDFRLIASLGFNFVRIPMDYRCWLQGGDWEKIDEGKLADIDRVVALGEKYGVHVSLNFHRAPGYTVAKPAETRSLWKDADAQRVCAMHWAAFARRYQGIPSARLSFNLFNEPAGVTEAGYFAVVRRMVEVIRAEDPGRLVLCDGLDYGNVPPLSLRELGVGLCTRGYRPMNISHYRANWINGADRMPPPEWPAPQVSAFLYGSMKKEFQSPLVLTGPLGGKTLRLHVNTVSSRAKIVATDAAGATLWEHLFVPGPGEGEWQKVVHRPEYGTYQNIYDRDYTFALPAGTTEVQLRNVDGDWLTLSWLSVESEGRTWKLNLVDSWGLRQTGAARFTPDDHAAAFHASATLDRAWLRDTCYDPWRDAQQAGLGVMIGEMGAFQHTPHAVVLRWMEDVLATARESGFGWALWNFRSGFGVLDSNRTDITYEEWQGHQLDRAMLELLQRY